jgi:hypothetical protein
MQTIIQHIGALSIIAIVVFSPGTASPQEVTTGIRRTADKQSVVNFTELAQRRVLASASPAVAGPEEKPRPVPRSVRQLNPQGTAAESLASSQFRTAAATLASPLAIQSFQALADNNTAIPPDTMGAVGPNHIMTTLNSQIRIQDRTGAVLSTVDMNSFWSSLGSYDVYDPRVTYDPFGGRWIFSAAADANLPTAAILVAVSATSDPTGNWYRFVANVDPQQGDRWADFDALGFNKNWIVVTANIFPTSGPDTNNPAYYVFDKSDLYTNGAGAFTEIKEPSSLAFSVAPAQTFDSSLATVYLIEDWDNTTARLRISTITGPVGTEVLTSGTFFPTGSSTWEFMPPVDNFLPQLGSTHNIDGGDSRILSCSYRNGSLWCSQTVFLPINAPTRAAAQWWQINPTTGGVEQFGRIDDPTGVQFFAYPSIAANANSDVLVGYSRFSTSQSASGNYSFRFADDAPNTLRADTILKAGEGPYFAAVSSSANRWGDFSATVVDPVNNLSFWTIQEYAGMPVGNPLLSSSGRWGTWWGRIDPVQPDVTITRPADGMTYPTGANVTITATVTDTNVMAKVEFFANGSKIGEVTSSPFTFEWTGVANGSYSLTALGTEISSTQSVSAAVNITVGDAHSPLGTWELAVSGASKGAAYMTFADDFTFDGYGMVAGTFGLYTISGSWSFGTKHQVTSSYTETLNGIDLLSGLMTAKATSGKSLKASVGAGKVSSRKLSGKPASATTDVGGTWNIVGSSAKVPFSETYTLTPSASFDHVFDLSGIGTSNSLSGSVLINSRNQLNVSTTNGVVRSLTGKLNVKKGSASLKGSDNAGHSVKIQATRQ